MRLYAIVALKTRLGGERLELFSRETENEKTLEKEARHFFERMGLSFVSMRLLSETQFSRMAQSMYPDAARTKDGEFALYAIVHVGENGVYKGNIRVRAVCNENVTDETIEVLKQKLEKDLAERYRIDMKVPPEVVVNTSLDWCSFEDYSR